MDTDMDSVAVDAGGGLVGVVSQEILCLLTLIPPLTYLPFSS